MREKKGIVILEGLRGTTALGIRGRGVSVALEGLLWIVQDTGREQSRGKELGVPRKKAKCLVAHFLICVIEM